MKGESEGEILTKEDLATLISRFSSSIYRLEQTGDYPEKERDKGLLKKLITMQFESERRERKGA